MEFGRPGLWIALASSAIAVGCSQRVHSTAADDDSALTDEWNVLFIVADDMNDWVGCMGGSADSLTPNVDRLARRGMVFTQAHTAFPLSGPSRCALLTGMLPSTTRVFTQKEASTAEREERFRVLPERFEDAGYATFGCGKILHGSNKPGRWTEYASLKGDVLPPRFPMCGLEFDNHFDWGALDVPIGEFGDAKHAEWLSGKIADAGKGSAFFALGIAAPHTPMYAPREFHDMHPLDGIHLPPVLESDGDDLPAEALSILSTHDDHRRLVEAGLWDDAVQAYLASSSFMDRAVGEVLDALDASPMKDRTIIVFTSDHGWHLGQKGCWRKDTLWNESTHVPLIVCIPGMENANTRCDRVVSLVDVQATMLELCGLPKPKEDEGRSLVPLLADPQAPWDDAAATWRAPDERSIRTAEWCYIRYAQGEELYDRRADPHEWHNLADDPAHAADVEAMRAKLLEVAGN